MTDRIRIEPNSKRVRVKYGGEIIADSTNMLMLHEIGYRPVYYFPIGDVASVFLKETTHETVCPWKGTASYWSITTGRDNTAKNAVWGYREPVAGAEALAGHVAFYWNMMDHWYEEDEEIFVHARDPYVRIDVIASSRPVTVSHGGEVLAETTRAKFLFETSLPVRYYIPADDVRAELLSESATVTRCPYKGFAVHFSLNNDAKGGRDLAWMYREPVAECARIAGHYCFYNERVDLLTVDGVALEKPETAWSQS